MDCPACRAENTSDAAICAACGRPFRADDNGGNGERKGRPPDARRRKIEASEAAVVDSPNPAAWRAYRVSVWSVVPGFGLLLGPLAMGLGALAVRDAGHDLSARNRAKAAMIFGTGSALTQWLGITLLYFGWPA
jgi:hypothetical protein